jgi:hypothetical protein
MAPAFERRDQGCAPSSVHPTDFAARNDLLLLGERAATRRRRATEGGDEREVWRGAIRRAPALWQPRSRTAGADGMNVSLPHSADCVAGQRRAELSQRKLAMRTPVRVKRCRFEH